MPKKKKQKGVYTKFRYLKELVFYYVRTTPAFLITIFLLCLVIVLFLSLKWGNDSNNQPIGVIIVLQIAYATLASILFYVITFLIPQQTKTLKFSFLVRNSSSYIHRDVSDLFKTFAKPAELKNSSNEFYRQSNLRRLVEELDATQPITYVHTVLIFSNAYEVIEYSIANIEEKANRLIVHSDILSVEAMDALNSILGVCLNIKLSCQFTRQKDLSFLSSFLCQLYMEIDILSKQIFKDFSFRMLYHYINMRKQSSPESKDFYELFWGKSA